MQKATWMKSEGAVTGIPPAETDIQPISGPELAVLMSVWRTCRQQGRQALDFLSQCLRGGPVGLALPP
jgi:hypothetical protein